MSSSFNKKLKVSGVAKGQYRQLCPFSTEKSEREHVSINYKIRRAVSLGKVVHSYNNGCKIIRYHNLNFLSDNKEIMTIWRDDTTERYDVDKQVKELYDEIFREKNYTQEDLRRVLGDIK